MKNLKKIKKWSNNISSTLASTTFANAQLSNNNCPKALLKANLLNFVYNTKDS